MLSTIPYASAGLPLSIDKTLSQLHFSISSLCKLMYIMINIAEDVVTLSYATSTSIVNNMTRFILVLFFYVTIYARSMLLREQSVLDVIYQSNNQG